MGNVKPRITLFFLSLHTSKNSLITSFAIKLPFLSKPVVFFIQLKTCTWLKHDFLLLLLTSVHIPNKVNSIVSS